MSNYTRKEQQAIRDAYGWLEYLAYARNQRDSHELAEALKHERRQRSDLHAARVLILDCFAQGFRNPTMPAHELYSYSDGCRLSLMWGAEVAHYVEQDRERYADSEHTETGSLLSGYRPLGERFDFPDLLDRIDQVKAISRAETERSLAALRD